MPRGAPARRDGRRRRPPACRTLVGASAADTRTPRRSPGRSYVRLLVAYRRPSVAQRSGFSRGSAGRSDSPALITMLTIENSARSANTTTTAIEYTLRCEELPWTGTGPTGMSGGVGARDDPARQYTLETKATGSNRLMNRY